MRTLKICAVLAIAALSIAASDMDKFYHTVPHNSADVPTNVDTISHPSSGNAKEDVVSMETAGFELIGYSEFNGRDAGQKNVAKEAKRVGASDVIYIEHYTDTQSAGAIGSTSFSRWGALSFVTPMTVRRYDQLALYFRKAPREGIGIHPRLLTDEEKVRIGSNKGLVVLSVTNGSPAFMADVLPGDILIQLNGHAVWDAESAKAALESAKGKTTDLQIIRGGQQITKQVTIPAGNW